MLPACGAHPRERAVNAALLARRRYLQSSDAQSGFSPEVPTRKPPHQALAFASSCSHPCCAAQIAFLQMERKTDHLPGLAAFLGVPELNLSAVLSPWETMLAGAPCRPTHPAAARVPTLRRRPAFTPCGAMLALGRVDGRARTEQYNDSHGAFVCMPPQLSWRPKPSSAANWPATQQRVSLW